MTGKIIGLILLYFLHTMGINKGIQQCTNSIQALDDNITSINYASIYNNNAKDIAVTLNSEASVVDKIISKSGLDEMGNYPTKVTLSFDWRIFSRQFYHYFCTRRQSRQG